MADSLPALRIYLTGGVRIECTESLLDDSAFAFPHSRLSFAFLICERGRPVPATELARVVWDNAPPANAATLLRSVMQRLRRVMRHSTLAGNVQLLGTDPYTLKVPSDAWVDIEAAGDAIHQAEGELRATRPPGAFGPSAVAHHIARRPFLPGEHSAWVEAQRLRLRGILVRALECRGEVYLWNRESPLAIEAAKEAIALEPFRETAHQLLIRAHATLGNAAEATRAYENCRSVLGSQLGIEPSVQTQLIYRGASSTPTPQPPQQPRTASQFGTSGDFTQELQRLLADTYVINQEIFGGGMSRAFLADERALGRQIVIKVLPPDKAETVSADRFTREVRLAATLQQANIVPLLSAAIVGGLPYYTMPYVAGQSLRAVLGAHQPLPIPRVISILRDVARALAFAHARGVVHRDIKPENILLSGDTAVVTDFGIATAFNAPERTHDYTAARLTQAGMFIGPPQHTAPEQATGDPTMDHRADIYSFGIVAYELLTGTTPFADRSPQATLTAHLVEVPRPIAERRPTVPKRLADVVMQCLEKDPNRRPQTVQTILSDLE